MDSKLPKDISQLNSMALYFPKDRQGKVALACPELYYLVITTTPYIVSVLRRQSQGLSA